MVCQNATGAPLKVAGLVPEPRQWSSRALTPNRDSPQPPCWKGALETRGWEPLSWLHWQLLDTCEGLPEGEEEHSFMHKDNLETTNDGGVSLAGSVQPCRIPMFPDQL